MSEIKHTPGPWKADVYDYPLADTGDYCTSFLVLDSQGDTIATCDYTKDEDDETVANLNLLAAAPELLEALLWCKSQGWIQYTKRIPNQNAAFCDGVDKALAAIAKAIGSQS